TDVSAAPRTALHRGPWVAAVPAVEVRAVHVQLDRVTNDAARHELAQADGAAKGREAGTAVGSGLPGPIEVLVSEHVVRRRSLTGASRERLRLNNRVSVRREDRGGGVRGVSVLGPLVVPGDH